jgi:hypothetical protein
MNKQRILLVVAGIVLLLILGTCISTCSGPTSITSEQLRLINTQLDNLHKLIVMTRTSGFWMVLLFLVAVLTPIVLGLVLLNHADRIAIRNDEIFRQIHEHGLTSEVIDTAALMKRQQEQQEGDSVFWQILRSIRSRMRAWRSSGRQEDSTDG